MLVEDSTFTILNLSDNPITDACAIRIAEAFERNSSIHEMYFFNTPLTLAGKSRLAEAAETARKQVGRSPILVCY